MTLDRRDLLIAAGAAGAAAALPGTALAQISDGGAVMRVRADAFLSSLDGTVRSRVLFPFDTPQRQAWNFMLGARKAPGLALEEMKAAQKELALDLLASGTSALGLEKARNIMLQQDILRDEWGKGAPDRNRERFSVQIYGRPSARGAWSWRWEGHHLSLTFTMVDDQVVSTTPSAFSSEPNTVPSGPHAGLVVLKEEESLARRLYGDLTGRRARRALVSRRPVGNIISVRGGERDLAAERLGVPLADLTATQGDMLMRLIEVYATEVLPKPLARTQSARIASEDREAIRFAWGGANLDRAIYYRITGADLMIEFASLVNQPQHLHAVFHDVARNFGRHAA